MFDFPYANYWRISYGKQSLEDLLFSQWVFLIKKGAPADTQKHLVYGFGEWECYFLVSIKSSFACTSVVYLLIPSLSVYKEDEDFLWHMLKEEEKC